MSNKIRPFKFLKSINFLLLVAAGLTAISVGLIVLAFALQNNSDTDLVILIITCILMVFPIGLLLLSIVATVVTSILFSRKNVCLNNFSSLEALPNLNVLCVDKDGAITDGELVIKKVIPLKATATEEYLAQWISNVLKATNDNSVIARALLQKYDLELTAGVVEDLPFYGKNNYMGASFTGGKTIIIGKIEDLPIKNVTGIVKRCEEEFNNGYTVLVVGEGKEQITDGEYNSELEPLALIVLKDHVRESAFETFKWFKNNGIEVKVISSDSAISTSVVAIEAGVNNADKYISLEAMSAADIERVAFEYTVFGDANAGQKRVLIDVLRKAGNKVMLIGEGNNDESAMKHSDCSAIVDDNDETLREADIVLTNSSFGELPSIFALANNMVSHLLKITSLFITKIIFGFVSVLAFAIYGLIQKDGGVLLPYIFNNFLLWDVVICGASLVFLLLEENNEHVKGSFLANAIRKSIPGALLLLVSTLTIFVFYVLQQNGMTNLGIYSINTATAMSVVVFNVLGLLCLYKTCSPLNKYRTIVLAASSGVVAIVLIATLIITIVIKHTEILLRIPYLEFNGPAIMTTAIIIAVCAALYMFIYRIIDIKEGDNLDED